jgi:hypothetical protein
MDTKRPTWNNPENIASAGALPDTFIWQSVMYEPSLVQAATRAFHPLNTYRRHGHMLMLTDRAARLTGKMRIIFFRLLESDYTHALALTV